VLLNVRYVLSLELKSCAATVSDRLASRAAQQAVAIHLTRIIDIPPPRTTRVLHGMYPFELSLAATEMRQKR
jgi:hypothetical protein